MTQKKHPDMECLVLDPKLHGTLKALSGRSLGHHGGRAPANIQAEQEIQHTASRKRERGESHMYTVVAAHSTSMTKTS